jgi:hypothetical protein
VHSTEMARPYNQCLAVASPTGHRFCHATPFLI